MNQPSQAQRANGYEPCFLGCNHPQHARGKFLAYEVQSGVRYEVRQCPKCKIRTTRQIKADHLAAGTA